MGATESTSSSASSDSLYGCCMQERGAGNERKPENGVRYEESEHRKFTASVAKLRSVFKERWSDSNNNPGQLEKEALSAVMAVAVMEERNCVEVLRRLSPSERKEWVLTLQSCLQRVTDSVETRQAVIKRFGMKPNEQRRFNFLLDNPKEVTKLNNLQATIGRLGPQMSTPTCQATPCDPERPVRTPPPSRDVPVGQWPGPLRDEKDRVSPFPSPSEVDRRPSASTPREVAVGQWTGQAVSPIRRKSSTTNAPQPNIEAVTATYYTHNPVLGNARTSSSGRTASAGAGDAFDVLLGGRKKSSGGPDGEGLVRKKSTTETDGFARRKSVERTPSAESLEGTRPSNSPAQTPNDKKRGGVKPRRLSIDDSTVDLDRFRPSDQCHQEHHASLYDARTPSMVGTEIPWTKALDPMTKVQ